MSSVVGKVTLTGIHPYSYRCGKPAIVTGVVAYKPDGCDPRPCLAVLYPDGQTDFVPFESIALGQVELKMVLDKKRVR